MRASRLALRLCCAGGLFAAEATLAVPGNLKADGLPPISSTVYADMARYNESRSAPLVDWHPARRVNYTEGQQMTAAVRANHVPGWYLLADDEGHGFAKKKNRDFLNAATVEFVEKYLLGEK